MRRETHPHYGDQFEYLADCFEVTRLRCDAYGLRTEALETERMARYSERHGFDTERNHLLEIYYDLERSISQKEQTILRRKQDSRSSGTTFAIDQVAEAHHLSDAEVRIVEVLLYNEALGRHQTRYSTGNDLLNLLFPNPVDALRHSALLGPSSNLVAQGLVRMVQEDDASNFLRHSYEASEKVLREVLGVRLQSTNGYARAGNASGGEGERDIDQLAGELQSGQMTAVPEGPFRALDPRFTVDRVILDVEARSAVEDVLWQVREGRFLLEDWEMGKLLEKGRGVVALFAGLPGTGKTMTAEAMAGSLGKKLLIADYAQLESKWIGETEKNIVAVFRMAAELDAVLLIDEADAILAGRLDGNHYNDRAYNRQVSLLLQELENFDGLCVLTTNREMSLDVGLARRISASITFGVPQVEERERLWRGLVSPRVPLAADVDFTELAARFALTGGHIKNVVVAALRGAARAHGANARLTQADFIRAAEAEKKSFIANPRAIGFKSGKGFAYS